jgi:tetrahydromethanopterin S-methyltransferase subunit B
MKIVETVELINSDKVWIGDKEIKLTLDTETGRITFDAPAMFTDPIVRLDLLQEKIAKLKSYLEPE